MSEQRKKAIITKILLDEDAIQHIKTVLPVLPDGTYHNYELYASFTGQRYNVSDMTFDTDYRVLILEGIRIIGIAIYTHTESAELLFDHIMYPQMECVLFNENEVFNMKDWFCGTSVFDISVRKYWAGSQTKNYITSIFTLNQHKLVAFDLNNGGTILMDGADNSAYEGSNSEVVKNTDNKYDRRS
ncbi:hypothetical protein [Acetobacterium wieringae]|uniref:Uncharacterized protein n=1 Tax=Acetobacterium wieringae TaxID=52694 RepID=A0A1F2PK50_9FIRM|nr:hypothetical protein [Acetobacterium wieringae]OFV71728.1 hypothetical protein ACWI_07780 [Acetobacterium wieringae]URN85227.1 hypothetical protein CHL1_000858 [Acetobacterium wieringae]